MLSVTEPDELLSVKFMPVSNGFFSFWLYASIVVVSSVGSVVLPSVCVTVICWIVRKSVVGSSIISSISLLLVDLASTSNDREATSEPSLDRLGWCCCSGGCWCWSCCTYNCVCKRLRKSSDCLRLDCRLNRSSTSTLLMLEWGLKCSKTSMLLLCSEKKKRIAIFQLSGKCVRSASKMHRSKNFANGTQFHSLTAY